MGSVYVPVDVANAGIMPMDASGGGGQTGGGYWINWTASGYEGHGWFWYDTNNYLKTGWENAVAQNKGDFGGNCTGNHTSTFESFKFHIESGHTEDLNAILGSWPNDEKLNFVLENAAELGGCVTATAS